MRVYAFVGKSGTGKSHHSMQVAKENNIDYIIDDGLLMSDNRIIAGRSAKREATMMASVKCAVFSDSKHAAEVREALKRHNVQSVLLIGTSEKMVKKIADALQLPPIEKTIFIEDVSSPEQIELAHKIRVEQGKHIIPVPTFEVKKQFSGYFMDSINLWNNKKGKHYMAEKTVIRPTYSYLGGYKISNRAIAEIAAYETKRVGAVKGEPKIHVISHKNGFISINVDVVLGLCRLFGVAKEISKNVKSGIENMTSLNVKKVNVNVKAMDIADYQINLIHLGKLGDLSNFGSPSGLKQR